MLVIQVDSKMFVWFEMKKTCALPPEDSFPSIELYPCVYKKRWQDLINSSWDSSKVPVVTECYMRIVMWKW